MIAPKSVPAGTLPATSVRTAINKAGQQHIPHGKVMHTIKVSDTRTITLSTADLSAVHLAHDILTEKYKNPPTVHELSEQVSLSMQKLNLRFSTNTTRPFPTILSLLRWNMGQNC